MKFVQIQAIFVSASLVIQEIGAILSGAERSAQHSIVHHVLIDCEDRDCGVLGILKCHICTVTWTDVPFWIIDIVRIDHYLIEIPVLTKVFCAGEGVFLRDFW